MTKKNIVPIIVLVVMVAAALVILRIVTPEDTWICDNGQWVKHGNPSQAMPATGCGQNNNAEINFSKAGNITNFDSKTQIETQAWYFLYEEPGKPAISKLLVISSNCLYHYINGNSATCLDAGGNFYNGQRVKIDGQLTDNALNAVSIYEQASASQMANPASVYCGEQGGTSQIVTADDGSQSGICKFSDGRQCDEWDFFRSHTCTAK